MDSTGKQRVTASQALRGLYEPVASELEEVEALLQRELSSDNPFVDRLAQHGARLGGKRLRPALVLLSAKACGGVRPEHLTLAAMVEVIHTATLIHDDVLDEATIRRHLDTVNARWNNEVSILLGDYLLARAICLASSLDENFACRAISESARHMCEGELRQIESRGNFDLSEGDYFEIIAGKTATLTACCCGLGSHYAGAELPLCEALSPLRPRSRRRIPNRRRRARHGRRGGRGGQVVGHRPVEAESHAAADSAVGNRQPLGTQRDYLVALSVRQSSPRRLAALVRAARCNCVRSGACPRVHAASLRRVGGAAGQRRLPIAGGADRVCGRSPAVSRSRLRTAYGSSVPACSVILLFRQFQWGPAGFAAHPSDCL